ncbi:Txe/YoeB family addiction module toxin [Phytobacter sp. V91]|uniref:Txe/YoeB family addiction module toxin n=1 Tax=Phytobacter sp. V91 TaxID=3369425 RepID=UPI003F62421E
MKLIWSVESWNDYLFWQETDKRMVRKINELIKDIRRTPFEGKGKPEPLKYNLSGFWSRRITSEHRLVYSVTDDALLIAACRYHY